MTTRHPEPAQRERRSPRRAVGLATALCLGAAATASALAQADPAAERTRIDRATADALDDAQRAYDEGRWEAAYRTFAALADVGDAEAARIAWLMHRHGPSLYRTVLPASDAQRLRWQHLSATVVPLPFRSTVDCWHGSRGRHRSVPTAGRAGARQPRR
jgi:hypothetical protein